MKFRNVLFIGAFIFSPCLSLSQEATEAAQTDKAAKTSNGGWQKQAVGSFNFTEAYYSDNWAAGGDNAISFDLKFNGFLEKDMSKTNWKNSLKADYGQIKLGDTDFRKNLDEFFFESLYSYKLSKLLNPYASFTVQSQFSKGYKYTDSSKTLLSDFWDPGYIKQSIGMGLKPREKLLLRLGFSIKETFSRDHGYADDLETTTEVEEFKIEPGLEAIAEYSQTLNKIVKYDTKLGTFVNFKGVEEIDGRWENILTAQISKYLNVNFNYEVLYDHDLHETYQVRRAIAVGLNYTFL